jgi:cell division initiation protein
MKISAIDIRKHTFEKIFRGYDPEAVDAFLNSLSQEWERVASENNLLKMQLEMAEKELNKLKDIESSLFRTLKTAEDTGKLIEKEANEVAKQKIDEANKLAAQLLSDAQGRTGTVIQESEEKLKQYKEQFKAELKAQERDLKAIENFRDNLIVQLSSLANSTIETVSNFQERFDKESIFDKIDEMKLVMDQIEIPEAESIIRLPEPVAKEAVQEEIQSELPIEEPVLSTAANIEEEMLEEEEPFSFFLEQNEPIAATEIPADTYPQLEESAPADTSWKEEEPVRVNKFRSQETPKHQDGGGSFFDQI